MYSLVLLILRSRGSLVGLVIPGEKHHVTEIHCHWWNTCRELMFPLLATHFTGMWVKLSFSCSSCDCSPLYLTTYSISPPVSGFQPQRHYNSIPEHFIDTFFAESSRNQISVGWRCQSFRPYFHFETTQWLLVVHMMTLSLTTLYGAWYKNWWNEKRKKTTVAYRGNSRKLADIPVKNQTEVFRNRSAELDNWTSHLDTWTPGHTTGIKWNVH
jgi:hypothetical protein